MKYRNGERYFEILLGVRKCIFVWAPVGGFDRVRYSFCLGEMLPLGEVGLWQYSEMRTTRLKKTSLEAMSILDMDFTD